MNKSKWDFKELLLVIFLEVLIIWSILKFGYSVFLFGVNIPQFTFPVIGLLFIIVWLYAAKWNREKIQDTSFVFQVALFLATLAMYTDYTLSIFRIVIPQWLLVLIVLVLVIGWVFLMRLPDKYDKDGNPLKEEHDGHNV